MAATLADQEPMADSISSVSDPTAAIVAMQQAQVAQKADVQAAKMVMEVQKDSGTRLIESLIKAANAQSAVISDRTLDVLA